MSNENETAADMRIQTLEMHQKAIEASQRREERTVRRTMGITITVVVLLLMVLSLFVYYARNQHSILASTIKEFTYVQEQFKFRDLGVQAQKEAFRKFGMKLFTVHGKAYDSKVPQAFSTRQKVEFLELSRNISEDLNKLNMPVTAWDGLATGISESDLNPYCNGPNGEEGTMQFKWATAMTAYGFYLTMPDWFQDKYSIELNRMEDLENPYVSGVLFYVYYGSLLKRYKGSEMWAMSEYHWGLTFLGNSYKKGHGDLPVRFVIEGKDYFVADYWCAWVGLRDALEMGQLEVGKSYARDLHRLKKRMLHEEVTLNNSKNVIKKLRNEVREMKELSARLQAKVDKWGDKEEKAYLKFTEIYDIIQSGDFKNIKVEMNKHKPVVKEWVKKYEEKNRRQQIILQATVITCGILILTLIISVLVWAYKWRKLKFVEAVEKQRGMPYKLTKLKRKILSSFNRLKKKRNNIT